jgi:murein DD-endopeptidase MepM/ murein hydrolase activator NlpD
VRTVFLPANKSVLSGMSLFALLAGLGACSNIDSLRSPIFTGSTSNQQQVLSGTASPLGNTYYGSQTAGVQGADLPPPPGSSQYPQYAAAPGYTPAPAYGGVQQAPQAYIPPQSYAATGDPTPVTQLASAEPGQMQLGAPPTTLGAQAAHIDRHAQRGTATTHLVQPGDTAWNISQRYGISVSALAAANGGSTNVRLGQRIVIPGGGTPQPGTHGVQLASLNPADIPAPAPVAPMPAVPFAAATPAPAPAPVQQAALAPQTGNAGSLAPLAPEPAADATEGFRWPVRGRIISSFGKKPNGERNDGINLAVPEGTSVKAAEDGTVIYAGNELKSYGNLVLIRHANGWVSAYAHNSKLEVKRGDQVKRGQVIALSGMSGGVTTPQVHFELRKEATPVDPLQHLSDT